MKIAKRIFWGVFFIAAAVLIVLSSLGYISGINIWVLIATIPLVAILVSSIPSLNFGGILMPIGFLFMLYSDTLVEMGFPKISNSVYFFAPLLIIVGLSIMFKRPSLRKDYISTPHFKHRDDTAFRSPNSQTDKNTVIENASFTHTVKYIHSPALEFAQFNSSFGKMEIYFDQTTPSINGAKIEANTSFGAIELYIPHSWYIVDDTSSAFGATKDYSKSNGNPNETPTVTITGNASFGSIDIYRI